MDSVDMIVDNIRLDLILRVFSNITNQDFLSQLEKQRDKLREEEKYIIDGVKEDHHLLDSYGSAKTREELLELMEMELSKGNEEKLSLKIGADWGLNDLDFADMDLDLGDLEVARDGSETVGNFSNLGGPGKDELSMLDLQAELTNLSQSEDIDLSGENIRETTIDAKKMLLSINGHDFPIYFVENDEKILNIFGKEPHELAFLWTFPEMKPVLNVPALLRLMNTTTIKSSKVSVTYEDPKMIEFKLLKGLLALNVKGGIRQ